MKVQIALDKVYLFHAQTNTEKSDMRIFLRFADRVCFSIYLCCRFSGRMEIIMKTRLYKIICLVLVLAAAVGLAGCYADVDSTADDLTGGIKARRVDTVEAMTVEDGDMMSAKFAFELFRAVLDDGENVLVSPLSVSLALAMVQNGAEGETLAQMETVLGLPRDEMNKYLYSAVRSVPENGKCSLKIANSVWFSDEEGLDVKRDFLQANADYYGADAYKIPFDMAAADEINRWVREKTDGMIEKLIDRLSPGAVMYLINALAFEGEWMQKYTDEDLWERGFTSYDGTECEVEFMHSCESNYLDGGDATGFIKYYDGGKFAFAALLPKEGMSVSQYVSTLDGESLRKILREPESCTVDVAIPKFECSYDGELSAVLASMGIEDAFNIDEADFSSLAERELFISEVIHKTYVSVDEAGTKAAAVSGVTMEATSSDGIEERKSVYLTRPFVYMIIDLSRSAPVFMGCVNSLGEAE